MKQKLNHLQPQPLWNYFEEILQIPRPSKKEEQIISFLMEFAEKNNLKIKKDKIGNILITKPATPGRENFPCVVLQSHLDMVCEKNNDKVHDFEKDPIEPVISGDWLKANGTTLGADNGIGIAASMAVLTAKDIEHGPLECLFTVDEETGLTGAFALESGFFKGKILLNLDSEGEGELYIGCAGGIDTLASLEYKKEKIPEEYIALSISVSGLKGGHSGDDIDKGRGNAIKILTRILNVLKVKYNIEVADIQGGNLRNAIAREAFAVIVVNSLKEKKIIEEFQNFKNRLLIEYEKTEPGLELGITSVDLPDFMVDANTVENLINVLYACPHGVLEMSSRMPGMVETSTNLASVKLNKDYNISITTSQRSELESRKKFAADMVKSVFLLGGAEVFHTDGYPGWTPNLDSRILKLSEKIYEELFQEKANVRSIHAGLECGLFLEKYPYLDMISFGPTIKEAHSPDEKIHINSTLKFWKFLKQLLINIE